MRPFPYLPASDLRRTLQIALSNQAFEGSGAYHVGTFPYDNRGIIIQRQVVDAADSRGHSIRRAAGPHPHRSLSKQAYMLLARSAAPSDEIDPTLIDKPPHHRGHFLWSLVVVPLVIGEPCIGHHRDRNIRQAAQVAEVVGHEGRAGAAIEAYRSQIGMLQTREDRFRALPGKGCSHSLYGDRNHNGYIPAVDLRHLPDRQQTGLYIQHVLGGLEQQDIGSPLQEPSRLD